MAVNREGLLAVTDDGNKCGHLLSKEGALLKSIGRRLLGYDLSGIAFDCIGNVWVTDFSSCTFGSLESMSSSRKNSNDDKGAPTLHTTCM